MRGVDVVSERVTYLSGDGATEIAGYVATPEGQGPHPAVLILRGVAGPEDGYTEIADRIAGWGYLAFLHGWKVRGDDPPDGPVIDDLTGAVAYLRSRPDVDLSRIAVFGFCRGGVHALMVATSHPEVRLVVVFHGFAFRPEQAQPGLQPFDLMRKITVPTLVLHGIEDEQAPIEGMRRLQAEAAPSQVQFKYYEGIRHGFAVRTHPGFDAIASRDSFEEARAFLLQGLP